MSYILEALKKSQQERELGQVPTLEALPPPQPRRLSHTSPWGLAALVVAGLALAVALHTALDRGEPPAAAPKLDAGSTTPAKSADSDVQASARRSELNSDTPQNVAPIAGTKVSQESPGDIELLPQDSQLPPMDAEPDPMETPVSDDWMEMDEQIGPAQPPEFKAPRLPRPKPARVVVPEPVAPPVPEDLRRDVAAFRDQLRRERAGTTPPPKVDKQAPEDPTKLKLPLEVQGRLPAFIMTAHIYDATPDKRFVVINSLKYKEGSTTRGGLTVEQILPDGVVLNFEHNRFYWHR